MTWERDQGSQQSAPAEAFGLLADDARIAILKAFWPDYPTPIPYSTIQERSGIEDNGRLNYHLGKLREEFVIEVERGYQLLPAGWQVLTTVKAGVFTDHVNTEKHELGLTCPDCGGSPVAWYRDGEMFVRCPDCERRFTRMAFPPRRVLNRDFEDVLAAYSVKKLTWNTLAYRGVCIWCGDRAENYVDPGNEWSHYEFPAVMECRGCGGRLYTNVAERLLPHPIVVSFFHERGVDVYDRRYWQSTECVGENVTARSRDPLELEVAFSAGEEDLRLLVTRDLSVERRERPRVPGAQD